MNNEVDFVNVYVETMKNKLFEAVAREIMTEAKLVMAEGRANRLDVECQQLRAELEKLQQKTAKKSTSVQSKLPDDEF